MTREEREIAERMAASLDRIGDLLALLVDMGKAPVFSPMAQNVHAVLAEVDDEAQERAERARAEVEAADRGAAEEQRSNIAAALERLRTGAKPLPQATNLARSSRGRPKETA